MDSQKKLSKGARATARMKAFHLLQRGKSEAEVIDAVMRFYPCSHCYASWITSLCANSLRKAVQHGNRG